MFKFDQHAFVLNASVLIFCVCLSLTAQAEMPASPFATQSGETNTPIETTIQAQVAVPDPKTDDQTVKTVSVATNPYLDTFITLQRQNVLLQQMVEREKSVTEMVQNYKKMGITYAPPKPDLKSCLELPNNLSCATAYPDRYADFLPPPAPLPSVPVIPVAISTDELPQAITKLAPDAGLRNLMWTDITCLQGACRAVITPDPTDPSARYSVKAGDVLPPGGTVEQVSPDGITIVNNKDTVHVPPAPTRPFSL